MSYYPQSRRRRSNPHKRGRGKGRGRGRKSSNFSCGRRRIRGKGRGRFRGSSRRRYNRHSQRRSGRTQSRNYNNGYYNNNYDYNKNNAHYDNYDDQYYYDENDNYHNENAQEYYYDNVEQYHDQYYEDVKHETPGHNEYNNDIDVSLTRVIFVANLSDDIDGHVLNDLFKHFGTIKTCIVKCNRNNESLGHGFVEFECIDSAIKAQNANVIHKDQTLLVGFANDQQNITLPHTSEIYFYCENNKQNNENMNQSSAEKQKRIKKNKSKAEMYFQKRLEKRKEKQLNKALTLDSMYGKVKTESNKKGHKLDKMSIDWNQVGILKDCCKVNYNGCRVYIYGNEDDVNYDQHLECIGNVRFPLVLFDASNLEQIKKTKLIIKSLLNTAPVQEGIEDKHSVFKNKKAKKKRNELINKQYASK